MKESGVSLWYRVWCDIEGWRRPQQKGWVDGHEAATLCGTVDIASSGSTSCTSNARENYSSDDALLLRLFS